MKFIWISLLLLIAGQIYAQGPPITADKPIMLGSEAKVVKTLTEIRVTDAGVFYKMPLMVHYLPTNNALIAVHIPFLQTPSIHEDGLGDIDLMLKYQFYRRDMRGKTFRTVFKTKHKFPTAPFIGDPDFGVGKYQSWYGLVAGYETLRYGISSEVRYRYIDGPIPDRIEAVLGFGLPLLKSVYPVNQLNLYFENTALYFIGEEKWNVMIAQGIQYAFRQWTFEASLQVPMTQQYQDLHEHLYSVFLGTRYIF